MSKKKVVLIAATCMLALCAFIGGAIAYLTDSDSTTNTFTIGEVRVDTVEPNYPGNGSDEVRDLVALEEVPKDPQIKNTGKNRAVMFIQVDIPMANIITAQEDGTRNPQANTELFDYRTTDGTFDSVHDEWVLLETTYLDTDRNVLDENSLTYRIDRPGQIGDTTAVSGELKDVASYCRRLYGYETVVEEDETTTSIFDVVRSANIIEDQIDNTTQNIVITAYAIQADNIHELTDAHYDDVMDVDQLTDIFRVYFKQSGEVDPIDADSSNSQTLHNSTLNITMSIYNTHLKLNTGDEADAKTTTDVKLSYTGKGQAPDYTFTSSDPEVASIDEDGNITAYKVGQTVITVSAVNPDNDKAVSASATVTVRDVNSNAQ